MASFTAAGTSYATWGQPMIPFFIFYSMFGFQRVGDLIWSFGDQRGRGFLLGATAGRTTLAGEGLQHCDGQSQLLASRVPELPRRTTPRSRTRWRVIVRDGIERMYGAEPEDCFYYLTLYNENYPMPAMPEGVEDGIVRGLYRFREAPADEQLRHRAQILASGTAMLARARRAADARRRVRRRRRRVERDELQAAARGRARDRAVEPAAPHRARRARRTSPSCCGDAEGPVVAVTDFMKAVPDQVARFVPAAVRRRSAPTATASPTRGPRCGATSRSTRRTSWSRCCRAWRRPRRSRPRSVHEAIARYDIDPDARRPPPHLTDIRQSSADAASTAGCSDLTRDVGSDGAALVFLERVVVEGSSSSQSSLVVELVVVLRVRVEVDVGERAGALARTGRRRSPASARGPRGTGELVLFSARRHLPCRAANCRTERCPRLGGPSILPQRALRRVHRYREKGRFP